MVWVRGHQVLASLGQQVQHHRLVLHADLPQGQDAAGGDRDRDRISGVAPAAVADRQHPHPGGQLGWHVQDLLAVANQPLGQRPPEAVSALNRPTPVRPSCRPPTQGLVALNGGRNTLAVEQVAVLIQCGGGMGGPVGVDADRHRHGGRLSRGRQAPGGQADFGQGRPLWSHSRSGAGRTAQPFLSQPEGGSGGSGATCRHPGTYGLQPRVPTRIQ
jgi:hypothetical protein